MIIILKRSASDAELEEVKSILERAGYTHHVSRGKELTIVGAVGTSLEMRQVLMQRLAGKPYVDRVVPVLKPYKLVTMEPHEERSTVLVGEVRLGPGQFTVIAGPCAVESEDQLMAAARAVKEGGGRILRGGAFKPRTSPYDFQGTGEEGLKLLKAAGEEFDLPVVTEARNVGQVEVVAQYADAIQIGARNMQNYDLLMEAGRSGAPVLLKRGFACTVEEWLKAAEYVASTGNLDVILCERGIRTFGTELRFTQDLAAVALVRELSHLPVIVDPSHGSGKRSIVPPVCRAALAIGADGILVEVHPNPEQALCDGPQQLLCEQFVDLMKELRPMAELMNRTL